MEKQYKIVSLDPSDVFNQHPELVMDCLWTDIEYHEDGTVEAYDDEGARIWFRTGIEFEEVVNEQ